METCDPPRRVSGDVAMRQFVRRRSWTNSKHRGMAAAQAGRGLAIETRPEPTTFDLLSMPITAPASIAPRGFLPGRMKSSPITFYSSVGTISGVLHYSQRRRRSHPLPPPNQPSRNTNRQSRCSAVAIPQQVVFGAFSALNQVVEKAANIVAAQAPNWASANISGSPVVSPGSRGRGAVGNARTRRPARRRRSCPAPRSCRPRRRRALRVTVRIRRSRRPRPSSR